MPRPRSRLADIDLDFEDDGGEIAFSDGEDDGAFVMGRRDRAKRRSQRRKERRGLLDGAGFQAPPPLRQQAQQPQGLDDFSNLMGGGGEDDEDDDDDASEIPETEDGASMVDDDASDMESVEDLGNTPGVQKQQQASNGYNSVEDEKLDLLNKLDRLKSKGIKVRDDLNVYSSIEDIRLEYKRVTFSTEMDRGLSFARKMLVTTVTGLEFLNTRFDPFDGVNLEGWAESVHENIDDYTDVLEELYMKYRGKAKVAPEIKLLLMLGGSAATHHITTTMFKSVMPDVNEILRQSPGLKEQMVNATKKAASASNPDISAKLDAFLSGGRPPTQSSRPENQNQEEAEAAEEVREDVSDIVSEASTATSSKRKKKVVVNL